MAMKYAHTNINAKDWRKLRDFYCAVFGGKVIPPERDSYGPWLDRVTGVKNAHVRGCHVALPGYSEGGPVLEIFTHVNGYGEPATFQQTGFGHIGFFVDDVEATFEKLLAHGGSAAGQITSHYYENMDQTLTWIFAKDPEGNLIEIMRWEDGKSVSTD
ncbi:MAG TPA: VOC family protein [Clostridiaceae bacterium]|nr:VOC family protein [Clostridiaceae bacterium]